MGYEHSRGHDQLIENWLKENSHDMVICPNQPGTLRISRKACAKRHLTAQKLDFNSNKRMMSLFEEIVNDGLFRCRDCPIGKEAAELFGDMDALEENPG